MEALRLVIWRDDRDESIRRERRHNLYRKNGRGGNTERVRYLLGNFGLKGLV